MTQLLQAVSRLVVVMVVMSTGCACAPRVMENQPTRPPDIRGTVSEVTGATLRVTASPDRPSRFDAAIVDLTSPRLIRWTDGSTATASDLRVGDLVSVWLRGPARESYPIQAGAEVLIIEAKRR